jgi:hypothetical protein
MNFKDFVNKYNKKILKKLNKGNAFIDYANQQIMIPYNYEFKIGELITTLEPGRLKTYCIIGISESQIIYAEVIVL